MNIRMRIVLLACLAAFWLPAAASAQGIKRDLLKDSPKALEVFRSVLATANEATVRVQCEGFNVALGTIVAADGWIVTKASQLRGNITCTLKDGRSFNARLVGVHEPYDLAMLKVDANGLPGIEWRHSREARAGKW